MSPMKPIDTVDDALQALTYAAGWDLAETRAALDRDYSVLKVCYIVALRRTEGFALSRTRLLAAWDVLKANGVAR